MNKKLRNNKFQQFRFKNRHYSRFKMEHIALHVPKFFDLEMTFLQVEERQTTKLPAF